MGFALRRAGLPRAARVDHARPTVNGSGYKMEGPPGLGIAAASAPAGACIW